MLLYISTEKDTAWKNSQFILSKRSDFHIVDSLSIRVHALPNAFCKLTSLPVDKILLLRYMNWSTGFRGLLFNEEMAPFYLKCMNSVLSASDEYLLLLTQGLCSIDSVIVTFLWEGEDVAFHPFVLEFSVLLHFFLNTIHQISVPYAGLNNWYSTTI